MSRRHVAVTLLFTSIALPGLVLASDPDPADDSIIPNCITVDPGGGVELRVQVIGNNGQPLGGNAVRVIFNGACGDDTTVPITGLVEDIGASCQSPVVLQGVTDDVTALIVFYPTMGGCCQTAQAVRIEADPGAVTLGSPYEAVSSTDWSYCAAAGRHYANGTVDLADFSAFTGQFLGTPADICYDYPTGTNEECDGEVNLSDFSFFQVRFLGGDGDCPPCE